MASLQDPEGDEGAVSEVGLWPEHDYTKGSLNRNIWLLAVPMALEMSMSSIFQIIDIFWVGKIGPAALAAVTISGTLRWGINSLAMGLGIGGMAVVARRMGEKDRPAANHATLQMIILSIAVALVLSILGFVLARPMLLLLGAEPEVVPLGVAFLRITFAGLVAIILVPTINSVLRGAGNATTAMWVLAFANGLNILLEPILIFGPGPFPRLGVAGSALSTVLAQGAGLALQCYILLKGKARVRIELDKLRIDLGLMWSIITIALPSTIQMTLRALSRVTLLGIIALYGTLAVAGYGIANRILMVVLVPGFGLGNASATLVGQNLGAHQPKRAEKTAWLVGGYNMALMTAAAIFFFPLADRIISIFNANPGVVEYGGSCLKIVALSYIFSALGIVMGRSLDGAGNTVPAMFINLFTLWVLQIPLAYLFSRFWGTTGIWVALGVANMGNGLMMAFWFRRGRWKLRVV
ncbi:MAG TPA: MATE family efflux transporter [Chloroflexi bacterium]|nr:MATE family efflux transporter [Chloroflexota bacterium]